MRSLLRDDLRDRGYHVFWIRKSLGLPSLKSLFQGRKRISQTEFTLFNQELAALLRAGLPLLQCLDIMLERMPNPLFRSVLKEVRDKVKSGTALSDAFRAHGDLFPRIYSASLVAGEKSGGLETVIQRYVQYLKLTEGTRKKVVAAMVYPIFLFISLIVAAAFLLLWVVPRFAGFFEGFDAKLPFLTVVLLTVAKTLQNNVWYILAALAAGVLLPLQLVPARGLESHHRPHPAQAPVPGSHLPPVRDVAAHPLSGYAPFGRNPSGPGDRHRRGLHRKPPCGSGGGAGGGAGPRRKGVLHRASRRRASSRTSPSRW